jgi:hypothetical protein
MANRDEIERMTCQMWIYAFGKVVIKLSIYVPIQHGMVAGLIAYRTDV